jgi:hypothetical protein
MSLVSGTSKVEIVSQAFSEIGSPRPVNDLNDTPTTSAASKRYDVLKLNALSSHPWRFAMNTAALAKLNETPLPRQWQYSYLLPDNFLVAYRIRPNVDYEQFRDRIYTNYNNAGGSDLVLDFLENVNEGDFPAYFVELMIKALASSLAMSVAQSEPLKQLLVEEYRMQMNIARTVDSQSTPNPRFNRDALIAAHRGSGRYVSSR